MKIPQSPFLILKGHILACKRVLIKSTRFEKLNPAELPRYQVDHGTTVFHRQPCLTMVGSVMTVVAGHGVYSTLDHGTLPTMAKNYLIVISLKISRK